VKRSGSRFLSTAVWILVAVAGTSGAAVGVAPNTRAALINADHGAVDHLNIRLVAVREGSQGRDLRCRRVAIGRSG